MIRRLARRKPAAVRCNYFCEAGARLVWMVEILARHRFACVVRRVPKNSSGLSRQSRDFNARRTSDAITVAVNRMASPERRKSVEVRGFSR